MIDFSDIFIKLLNTALLAAVFLFFVKKYLAKSIQHQMVEEESAFQHLHQKYGTLATEQKKIDTVSQQELHEQEILKQKLIFWNKSLETKQSEQKKELTMHRQNIHQKALKKRDLLAVSAAQKLVLPKALKEAKQELIRYFNDATHGTHYIGATIKRFGLKDTK